MISVWSDGDSSVLPGVGVALTRPLFAPSEELLMVISYPLVPHVRFVGCPTRWPPANGRRGPRCSASTPHLPPLDSRLFRSAGPRHDAAVGSDLTTPLFRLPEQRDRYAV